MPSTFDIVAHTPAVEVVAGGPRGESGVQQILEAEAWSNAVNYGVNQAVIRNNIIYVSIKAGTNHDPATSPTYWTATVIETVGAAAAAVATILDETIGGADATDALLKGWVAAEEYELLAIDYDDVFVNTISSATVKWSRDGSGGTFTTMHIDPDNEVIDEYEVSHNLSGKTVHQPRITLNADGQPTLIPALVVV
jgi:hypothetical protein